MEFLIIAVVILFIMEYSKKLSTNKFINENKQYFKFLKEDDYEFFLKARYGGKVDPEKAFMGRVRNGLLATVALLFVFLSSLSFFNVVAAIIVGYLIYKSDYSKLKKYYKTHLHEINMLLPYYLKSLEILIHHYTVPVALGKSIEDAPEIFKPGLNNLIEKINSGDSSIEPYMEFAKEIKRTKI